MGAVIYNISIQSLFIYMSSQNCFVWIFPNSSEHIAINGSDQVTEVKQCWARLVLTTDFFLIT